mmetsp:Transcript_38527/g.110170  ORF Transcript_38527/g.110170 Transcript_38527/m.110170 type:complete len:234 (-) Transcript_38527:91-792(-)
MVVVQCLELSRQDLLSHLSAVLDVVVAVRQNLGLHDRHQLVLLADGRITRECVCGFLDGEVGGFAGGLVDGQHGTPLSEPSTLVVVVLATLPQTIQTLCGGLSVAEWEWHEALVDLDARDDALGLEQVHHGLAVGRLLVQGLLEENGAADILAAALGLEQQLAVRRAVLLRVLHIDAVETLLDRPCRLVGCQYALAWCGDGLGIGHELLGDLLVNLHHGVSAVCVVRWFTGES